MTESKVYRAPTPHYGIELPSVVTEDYDDRVSSFWIADSSLALQISTYLGAGPRNGPTAGERLQERMTRSDGIWQAEDIILRQQPDCDRAAASVSDEDGVMWVHAYFTWPDFAIYATLSGLPEEVGTETNWALDALKSIRRNQ